MKLTFGRGNAKLDKLEKMTGKRVYTFSLLSGWSCPFAKDCMSKAVENKDGKRSVQDGKHTQFRCFSASQEAFYTNVYDSRKANYDALKSCQSAGAMADLILENIPAKAGIIRIHVGGDFFSQKYFNAWTIVAALRPDITFYAYTKSLTYWVRCPLIPDNLVLTASYGGRCDDLIAKHNLRFAKVVFSEAEAASLPIDHDDSHAADVNKRSQSFALLLHGIQPKGSEAAVALRKLDGKGSYSK